MEYNGVNKLYGIINIKTGKLETHLTNPGHKFWEVKGHCINALNNYKHRYHNKKIKKVTSDLEDLRVAEFDLTFNKYLKKDIMVIQKHHD